MAERPTRNRNVHLFIPRVFREKVFAKTRPVMGGTWQKGNIEIEMSTSSISRLFRAFPGGSFSKIQPSMGGARKNGTSHYKWSFFVFSERPPPKIHLGMDGADRKEFRKSELSLPIAFLVSGVQVGKFLRGPPAAPTFLPHRPLSEKHAESGASVGVYFAYVNITKYIIMPYSKM